MASNTICVGQRSACVFRATRLNADCTPAEGADNAVVTTGLVTLSLSPEVEEGATYNPTNACGEVLWSDEDPDRVLRYTGDGEIGLWDFELIELLTDAALLVGAASSPWVGENIGIAFPGPASVVSPGVALEVWVKNVGIGATGACGPAGTHPPYTRYVLPRVRVRPGDHSFGNEAKMFMFSLKANANPQWGEGPWGDWHPSTPSDIEPVITFWDDELPEAACGYISVPASSA